MKTIAIVFGFLILEVLSQSCIEPNGFEEDPSQCDAYTECKNGTAKHKLCPEGLMFNDKLTKYPRYPCSYPQEVECGQRTKLQPAQPTKDCPHQYGMYKLGNSPDHCGSYVDCVGGKANINSCPEGLAFNEHKIRCDWPDEVPGCDNGLFLRFQCPGTPNAGVDLENARFKNPTDCRKFFICLKNSKPRSLSCGVGFVFNPQTDVCDNPENVPECMDYYPKEVLEAVQTLKEFDHGQGQ